MKCTHALRFLAATIMGWSTFVTAVSADDAAPLPIEPPYAWNRSDRYEPPDFEAFFPDDVKSGEQLDLMLTGKFKVNGVDERLALIRAGLRRMSRHRTTLLASVGKQHIWNRDVQDARAIELMYHASASKDDDVAHYALYHGLTVVSERTPNLVRMLMDRYQSLDKQMQTRIAWGMKTYGDTNQTRRLMLELLAGHDRLNAATIGATLDTFESVFNTRPPEMERFDDVGQWVIAFHRSDLSADHPRAAEILRRMLDRPLGNRPEELLNFVTRVDRGHETAVALVKGMRCRNDVVASLSRYANGVIDFNEMLSPGTLQERRLREFANHLPEGLPNHAKPAYTRPSADEVYAYAAAEFIAPDFESYFAEDAEAGARLDEVYENRQKIELSDRELLDLFRHGVRRSSHGPSVMFGWISSALGWPRDPALTEMLYQGIDPNAPLEIRAAAIYYGFGLGAAKTRNILKAKFRVYMSPPFDRTTNGNMRGRILWGVRDHEDDKYHLAKLFEEALRDHASLSDEALRQADRAYQQLTGNAPTNTAEYSSRGVYLVMFADGGSRSVEESKQSVTRRLGESQHVIDIQCAENGGTVVVMVAVRGSAGMRWLVDNLQTNPKKSIYFADLLTKELIDKAEDDMLRDFEKHLLTRRK